MKHRVLLLPFLFSFVLDLIVFRGLIRHNQSPFLLLYI